MIVKVLEFLQYDFGLIGFSGVAGSVIVLGQCAQNSIPVSILSNQHVAEKQLCVICRDKVNDIIWE